MTTRPSLDVTIRQHITRKKAARSGSSGVLRHSDVVFYSLCATPRQVNCASKW
jgi:hypothetical protein